MSDEIEKKLNLLEKECEEIHKLTNDERAKDIIKQIINQYKDVLNRLADR